MNLFGKFTKSNAWARRYNLPLIPQHNNPWIYSAYISKIMGGFNTSLLVDLSKYAEKCQIKPGLFDRWPDGSGGLTSHDELMGLAYHFEWAASDILFYLSVNDGLYINKPELINPLVSAERFNVYRMVFLKPFLQACAGYRVGIISQIIWAGFIAYDLITHRIKEPDMGGRLRIWIMLEHMSKYPLTGIAIWLWKKVMHNKGLSPKKCFTVYLREVPVMTETAPEEF